MVGDLKQEGTHGANRFPFFGNNIEGIVPTCGSNRRANTKRIARVCRKQSVIIQWNRQPSPEIREFSRPRCGMQGNHSPAGVFLPKQHARSPREYENWGTQVRVCVSEADTHCEIPSPACGRGEKFDVSALGETGTLQLDVTRLRHVIQCYIIDHEALQTMAGEMSKLRPVASAILRWQCLTLPDPSQDGICLPSLTGSGFFLPVARTWSGARISSVHCLLTSDI
jgi:hypothetical protein